MSTTTVVVLVVAAVSVIVIALMIGLRRRAVEQRKPVARSAGDRYREDRSVEQNLFDAGPIPAPGATVKDNYRERPVDCEPPLPTRSPGRDWVEPEPFRDRRKPMIRREREIGPDHELSEDGPWVWPVTGDADVVQIDQSSDRVGSSSEPARCDPVVNDSWAASQLPAAPASVSDAVASRDDSGSGSGWSAPDNSGSGSGSGDGGSGGSSGGCD